MMLCKCNSLDLVWDGEDKQVLSTKPARKRRLVANTNKSHKSRKSHKSHNFWLKACMESDQVSFPRVFLWIRRFQQRVLQVIQNCQPFQSTLGHDAFAPCNDTLRKNLSEL